MFAFEAVGRGAEGFEGGIVDEVFAFVAEDEAVV